MWPDADFSVLTVALHNFMSVSGLKRIYNQLPDNLANHRFLTREYESKYLPDISHIAGLPAPLSSTHIPHLISTGLSDDYLSAYLGRYV